MADELAKLVAETVMRYLTRHGPVEQESLIDEIDAEVSDVRVFPSQESRGLVERVVLLLIRRGVLTKTADDCVELAGPRKTETSAGTDHRSRPPAPRDHRRSPRWLAALLIIVAWGPPRAEAQTEGATRTDAASDFWPRAHRLCDDYFEARSRFGDRVFVPQEQEDWDEHSSEWGDFLRFCRDGEPLDLARVRTDGFLQGAARSFARRQSLADYAQQACDEALAAGNEIARRVCLGRGMSDDELKQLLRACNAPEDARLGRVSWRSETVVDLAAFACMHALEPQPTDSTAFDREWQQVLQKLAEDSEGLRLSLSGSRSVFDVVGGAAPASFNNMIDVAIRGLASFAVSRAAEELEDFLMTEIGGQLCEEQCVEHWFQNTCALAGRVDGEEGGGPAPVRALAEAFREALAQDLNAAPDRALAAVQREVAPGTQCRANELARLRGAKRVRALLSLRLATAIRSASGLPDLVDRVAEFVESGELCAADDVSCTRYLQHGRKLVIILTAVLAQPNLRSYAPSMVIGMLNTLGVPELDHSTVNRLMVSASTLAVTLESINEPDATDEERIRRAAAFARQLVGTVDLALRLLGRDVRAELTVPEEIVDLADAMARRDLSRILVGVIGAVRLSAPRVEWLSSDTRRWLTFATSLASATTPEDAEAAIRAMAAPAGSWRAKRERSMVSVTALVGGMYGYEWLQVPNSNEVLETSALGLHLSLGVDINLQDGHLSPWTFGFYVPLIDLTSIASFPLTDDEVDVVDGSTDVDADAEQTFDPRSILAPGLFMRVGLHRSPIVLAFGASYVPYARDVSVADAEAEVSEAIRFSVLLAVDTTLIAF